MARGGHQKSRGKPGKRRSAPFKNNKRKFGGNKEKASFNRNGPRQEHSFYVKDEPNPEIENAKRQKLMLAQLESSDESENETEAAFNQLITTFSQNKKGLTAIQSSSESESEDADEDIGEDDDNARVENDGDSAANKNVTLSTEDKEETIEEAEIDEEEESMTNTTDPFVQHYHYEIPEKAFELLQIKASPTTVTWPNLGKVVFNIPQFSDNSSVPLVNNTDTKLISDEKTFACSGKIPAKVISSTMTMADLHIKPQIAAHIKPANAGNIPADHDGILTDFQNELFTVMNNYQDLYFPERSFRNGEQIRFVYCLHAVNHILKTRTKILHHNARLSSKSSVPEEFRDQGLVRPKVLIVVPFRDSALRIVEMLIKILVPAEKGQVFNKTRFMADFSGGELSMPKKNPKPDDYLRLFTGNTDDTFRIGLSVTKKTLKLYSEFYSSDIIIASPLGLRVIVGAPGEPERDYDFLASIEVLVMDQTEQFLMQNWDHLLHVMDHLHMQPKQAHGTDFSRVRMWSLNGQAKYHRQTLIFSSYDIPDINAFFNRKCLNYAGKAKVINPIKKGTICHVLSQLPHVFHKFKADTIVSAMDQRFEFFKDKILPQFKDSLMKHTLVYIPSYFDFVRVRNYFKQEELSFVQICEYSKEGKIARARDMFYHAEAHFLLYSERFHHFRRIRLKGIRNIIFYQPPNIPNFYPELCNFLLDNYQNAKTGNSFNMSVTVMFCKYDMTYLNSIVGTDRTAKMLSSDRATHMFMTGE